MVFDSADVTSMIVKEIFYPVILHEMGHVLGIGTLWSMIGVTGPRNQNCTYQGVNGNREYVSISGCTGQTLPTEQDGSEGTRCNHFDDGCFVDELMTGYASGTMPISRITIATLQDLGYTVSYNTADTYISANMAPSCVCTSNRRLQQQNRNGKQLKIIKSLDTPNISTESNATTTSWEKRKLSEDGYNKAFEFGKKILLQQQQHFESTIGAYNWTSTLLSSPMKAVHVGANIINVIYHDGINGVFDVMVYN
jgi:Leishmanolysin